MDKQILQELLRQAKHVKNDLEGYDDKIISEAPIAIFRDLRKKLNQEYGSEVVADVTSWKESGGGSRLFAYRIDLITKYSELIGKIEASTTEEAPAKKKAQIFVSHGKNIVPLLKVERFIEALGLQPLIVKDLPSKGHSVNEAVNDYLSRSDCVIILATAENQIDGKKHTGENIINEEGLAKKYVDKKIVYLLEDQVDVVPSNFREKIYERFSNENMTDAFIKIAKELSAFRLI